MIFFFFFRGYTQYASRGAGGYQRLGLSGGDLYQTPCASFCFGFVVFFGHISEITVGFGFLASLLLFFLALRCPQERHRWRTSRLKTERPNMCWSDALLLTSIMILPSRCVYPSCVLIFMSFFLLVEQVSKFTGGWTETTGCTCLSSSGSGYMIIGASHVEIVQRSLTTWAINYQMISQASCILLVKHTVLTVPIRVALSALTDANICWGVDLLLLTNPPFKIFIKASKCAPATDAQTRGKS